MGMALCLHADSDILADRETLTRAASDRLAWMGPSCPITGLNITPPASSVRAQLLPRGFWKGQRVPGKWGESEGKAEQ